MIRRLHHSAELMCAGFCKKSALVEFNMGESLVGNLRGLKARSVLGFNVKLPITDLAYERCSLEIPECFEWLRELNLFDVCRRLQQPSTTCFLASYWKFFWIHWWTRRMSMRRGILFERIRETWATLLNPICTGLVGEDIYRCRSVNLFSRRHCSAGRFEGISSHLLTWSCFSFCVKTLCLPNTTHSFVASVLTGRCSKAPAAPADSLCDPDATTRWGERCWKNAIYMMHVHIYTYIYIYIYEFCSQYYQCDVEV